MPKAGQKMLNPKTGRLVTVGSPTWRKLVIEGVLPNTYEAVDTLADVPEDKYEAEVLRAQLNEELGEEHVSKKGTGLYTNKFIKVKKQPDRVNILKQAKSKVKEVVREKIEIDIDEEIDEMFEKEFAELAMSQRRPTSSKLKKKYVAKKAPEPEPSSESDEAEQEDEGDTETE